MELQPGARIDRYEVQGLLGAGGLATVYRVRHVDLEAPRAMKVLHVSSRSRLVRLRREGKLQARLRHPGIVQVTDVVPLDSGMALVMELVEGATLGAWVSQHRPDLDERLRVFRGVVQAVGYAHEHGIVHRDLKPDNVLMSMQAGTWQPKVADFGLARALDEEGPRATRTGVGMGTPQFMAPEQIRDAARADHRADIFALGCILYGLACDRDAFEGETHVHVWSDILAGRLTDPAQVDPDLPGEVVAAIRACLHPDPELRPQSCEQLLAVLDGRELPAVAPQAASTFDADLLEGGFLEGGTDPSVNSAATLPPPLGSGATQDPPKTEGATQVAESPPSPPAAETLAPALSSSALQPPPAPAERRPGWLVPVAALALVLGGSGLWWASRGEVEEPGAPAADIHPQQQAEPEPVPEEELDEEIAEVPVSQDEPEPQAAPPAATPEPPATQTRPPPPEPGPAAPPEPEPQAAEPSQEPPVAVVVEELPPEPEPGATVTVSGEGEVTLRHATTGQRYPPGPVPPGRYEIEVRFGSRQGSGFPFTVVQGEVATLTCSATTEVCRKL